MTSDAQRAPADLERVRQLLNSWQIPNDVRVPVDRFDAFARRRRLRDPREAARVRALRDEIRAVVEAGPSALSRLNPWLARLGVRPALSGRSAAVGFEHRGGAAGDLLAIVLRAVQDGTWPRLKACPDCRWVFFDQTRNGKKRWCLMNAAGPGGRACGTLDKVRRFRARQRAKARS